MNIEGDLEREIEWEKLKGEEKIWGTESAVEEVARFYEKYKDVLSWRVRVRAMRGFNTATGLLEDLRKCHDEQEIKRAFREKEAKEKERQKKLADRAKVFPKF